MSGSSFLSFRFGGDPSAHPIQHIQDPQPSHNTFATNPNKLVSASKQPYGSGDHDDGYTLLFANMAAFQAWRENEEEMNMVEFVKVDLSALVCSQPPLIVR